MTDTEGIKTVLHPVTDPDRAKAMYTALLGIPPQADSPYYVGYEVAGQQIGLVPSDEQPTSKQTSVTFRSPRRSSAIARSIRRVIT